eukprot:scaffold9921_cov112-Isochrysis_galbana.AAC.3
MTRTPLCRATRCLLHAPAVPAIHRESQVAYSKAARPTPPATACTRKRSELRNENRTHAACTVHQVLIRVVAASNESRFGLHVCKRASHASFETRQL